jgi:Right handed beta helix region/Pectinesterase
MNDDVLERLFAEGLTGLAPTRAPAGLGSTIKTTTSRMRPRPRWLALVKEPPMRISSTVAVGSPTARMAAILAAILLVAILLTGVVVAGATALEGPGSDGPIIVAQDGSGDFTSIAEAVAAAADGDVIRVRPGTYPGSIAVDKDVTIRGEGHRGDIFIEIDPDGPAAYPGDPAPYGIHLIDSDATLASMTIRGPNVAIGVAVSGGAPTIDGIDIVLECCFANRPRDAFRYAAGAAGALRNVTTDGFARIIEGSSPTIERLDHFNEGLWIAGVGTDPLIDNSELSDLIILDGAQPTITGSYVVGVAIESTGSPVIRDSVIANPRYEFGDVIDNSADTVGIDIVASSPLVTGNRIGDHPYGIRVTGGAPTIEDNTIEHNAVGMNVMAESGMTFAGNTFCGNLEDLEVAEGAGVTLDGNEVCAG